MHGLYQGSQGECTTCSIATAYQGRVIARMEEQNKQQSEAVCSLFSLLESGNLLDYYERFLEQGGDDINQLCEATEEEFKEITKLVGMQTKPLHIRRLQKALVEWKNKTKSGRRTGSQAAIGTSWMDKWNGTQTSQTNTGITITKPTTTTLTITSPNSVNEPSHSVSEKKRGRPPNSSKGAKKMKSGVFELKLPPMEAIIDWESLDEERKQLIREHSRIYGRDTKKRKTHALNGHEQMINEAAAQLCLRDPTLLVRRDELFTQARRIVRDSGFSFVHGHSRSKYAGEPATEEVLPNSMAAPASKQKRQERLQEVDELLETSKQRQEVLTQKRKEFENANLPTSDIQQELSNLQRQIIALQSEQKELRKRQRRSERYYHTKENRRKSSSTISMEDGGETGEPEVHLEAVPSESVPEQESPAVVTEILQPAAEVGRPRVDQSSEEDSCVRGLFTIIPQSLPEGMQADPVSSQAIRASILTGAPVDSTINALLSLSSEDKSSATNIQALQNVLSQIALPHLVGNVASSSTQQLVSQVITTSQDHVSSSPMVQEPQAMQHQYVQQSGISLVPHLVSSGSSTPTTQLITQVVATTPHDHAPVPTQIMQESPQMTQYAQQPGVPMIQNLIECETQERL